MNKKVVVIKAFFRLFVFMTVISGYILFFDIENSSVGIVFEKSVGSSIEETENIQVEKAEDSTVQNNKSKEDLLEHYSSILADKLDYIKEYINIKAPDKSVEEFVKWLSVKYGINIIKEIAECENANLNKQVYINTGKSVIVLCDEFLGINDSIVKPGSTANYANILFAGDVCLAEDGFVLDYYDTVDGLKDCISEEIIKRTNKADIFMLNNEFCFSDRGNPLNGKFYTFRGRPDRISILQEMGVDIVSLANNHVYDYGKEAFEDTIKTLNDNGIAYAGGGNNSSEAEKVIYYEVNGIKIGIICASRAENIRYTPGAKENSPGIFLMYNDERLMQVTEEAGKQCDYLIEYLHWGKEDSKYYEEYQHNIAAALIDKGADIIIGGHPHVLQGFEYINGKPVIYSLGDFWFNSETKYNGMININIGIDGLKGINYVPCIQTGYTTVYVDDSDKQKEIYSYLNELSSGCQVNDSGEILEVK